MLGRLRIAHVATGIAAVLGLGLAGSLVAAPAAYAAPAAAMVTLVDPYPTVAGEIFEFDAYVDCPTSPVGESVDFYEGAAKLNDAQFPSTPVALDSATGKYFAKLSYGSPGTLAVGTHDHITAKLADGQECTGTSNEVSHVVDKAYSSTVVSQSTGSSSYGAPVTFTADVSGFGTPPHVTNQLPQGTVDFYVDNVKVLANQALDPLFTTASFTTSSLSAGTHTISASYSSTDGQVLPSSDPGSTTTPVTHAIVPAGTTTALGTSAATPTVGDSVTLTATVAPSGATGTVAFNDDGTQIGSSTLVSGQAAVTTSALTVGSHSITATYSGDANYATSTSAATTETVAAAATNTNTNTTATSPTGKGYWLAASTGKVYVFGDAKDYGSASNLNKPVVGIAATPSGNGYWLVATDGGIFSFGDAAFQGSTGTMTLNKPIVGMSSTPSGNGYYLVASDGGIFAFGDAAFQGSTGAITLNKPIVGMSTTPSGKGYLLVASDGGIFAFGDATFEGSTGAITLNQPIVGALESPTGLGYLLVAADGGIFAFGDAQYSGTTITSGIVSGALH